MRLPIKGSRPIKKNRTYWTLLANTVPPKLIISNLKSLLMSTLKLLAGIPASFVVQNSLIMYSMATPIRKDEETDTRFPIPVRWKKMNVKSSTKPNPNQPEIENLMERLRFFLLHVLWNYLSRCRSSPYQDFTSVKGIFDCNGQVIKSYLLYTYFVIGIYHRY